MKIVKNNPYFY